VKHYVTENKDIHIAEMPIFGNGPSFDTFEEAAKWLEDRRFEHAKKVVAEFGMKVVKITSN